MPSLALFKALTRPDDASYTCNPPRDEGCNRESPEIHQHNQPLAPAVTPVTLVTPPTRSPREEIDRPHVTATSGEAESWRACLASLDPHSDPCPGFRHWPSVQRAAIRFLDGRGAEAERLGWGVLDLFGVHPVAGAIRVDCTGALVTLWGKRVAELTPELIRFADGLAYRRRTLSPALSCPVWEFRPSTRSAAP